MFSLKIIDTDEFLDMPQSSQYLYYNLAIRADDDGFIANHKRIMKMIGCNDDDIKILIAKKFVIPFDSGVCVIRHWRIHNLIRSDRYCETEHIEEKQKLIENKGKYELLANVIPNVIPNGNQMTPQVRLGKVRLGKVKEEDVVIATFNQFWEKYPKKELKKKSLEIWKRKKFDVKLKVILDFISKAKETDRWQKGYVKQPPAFLNGECWNDDLNSYNDKKVAQIQGLDLRKNK